MAGYNITITSGAQGAPGRGVPAGGTANQFLQKVDGTDYNTQWVTSSATVSALGDVGDVTLTSLQTDEVLAWNGSAWVNVAQSGGGTWGSITGTLSAQTDLQAALDAKAASSHTHVKADITDADWITGVAWGDVTGTLSAQTDLQAALDAKAASSHTHVEADITDLQSYLLDITGESLTDLSDVPSSLVGQAGKLVKVNPTEDGFIYGDPSGTTVSWGDIAGTLSNQTDLQTALDGKSDTSHNHDGSYAPLTGSPAVVPNANISEASVTQHQAALSITESQISDLGTYEPAFTKNTAFNKDFGTTGGTVCQGNDARLSDARTPTAHTHVKADITDADWLTDITGESVFDLSDVDNTNLPEPAGSVLWWNGSNAFNISDIQSVVDTYVTISHTDLADKGTYTHPQIDSHIGDNTIHFTQASISITESQISDLGTYIPASEKAAVNGVATLGADGKVPNAQIPALAITETYTAASEVAQLALTVQEGDVCVRTDENKSYIALNGDNVDMGDWQELLTPTDAVTSVDGRVGVVTLGDLYATAAQGALADSATQPGDNVSTLTNDSGFISDITGEALGDLSNVTTGANDYGLLAKSAGSWIELKVNYAVTAPTVNDDESAGYLEGSWWFDLVTQKTYSCVSRTTGAAVWKEVTNVAEVNDLTAAVTWANVPDANITETSVTQHEAALTITESQISDLGNYATAPTTATVQTTDATPTTLATIAIPTDEEKMIDVKVHGHEDATDDHIWKRMTIGAKNIAGTASLVGGVDAATGYDAGASTWTIAASVSSGNVVITVTGEAAHTIDWRATTEID